jgi:predicted nucleic acid-binding protein
MTERVLKTPRSNEGEAEAVLQAAEIGVGTVIVDDPHGRRWAKSRGVKCFGILGIIETLRMQEMIPSVSSPLKDLAKHGYRLPAKEVTRLREKFGEADKSEVT